MSTLLLVKWISKNLPRLVIFKNVSFLKNEINSLSRPLTIDFLKTSIAIILRSLIIGNKTFLTVSTSGNSGIIFKPI